MIYIPISPLEDIRMPTAQDQVNALIAKVQAENKDWPPCTCVSLYSLYGRCGQSHAYRGFVLKVV